MKVSLNLAQSVSNIDFKSLPVDELVIKIGAQLGAVEEVVNYGLRYDGILVAKIVECVKHEDADKLNVCLIDDGGVTQNVSRNEHGHVQVVCGAPNAREGLVVAWIPPGVAVPSSHGKEPFILESREIRGVVSNGMLASPHELGIGDNHDGILEIEEKDAKPGQPFKELYDLDDVIIDIENKMFTHRPDCFGVLGVAREIAGITGQRFKSPDWYTSSQLENMQERDVKLDIKLETDLVPRFMAVAMKNVNVSPSPIWLQAGLARVGIKPINNIVDITNYLMYVTGQPLHAYDADKLPTQNSLGTRMSKKGEKVNLLNGKQLELKDETAVVITSGEEVIGIGGIMGGKDTEVSADTKNIIIECASFDMYNIRRTSMKYGLFTDAVTRFTKGQSCLQNQNIIIKTIAMVRELSGAMQASNVEDAHGLLVENKAVKVSTKFINDRLGSNLQTHHIASLLTNVEFEVGLQDELSIMAPFWRTDIEIAEDIVEEVGRMYGFDNLSIELPVRPAKPASLNQQLKLKNQVRTILSSAGANEVLTYSFVHSNLLEKVGQSAEQAFELANALSPDLQYFRTSLTPSLLELVHANVKAGNQQFSLFEVGKVHNKMHADDDQGLPKEFPVLSLVTTRPAGAGYYQARVYLDFLMKQLGITLRYDVVKETLDYPAVKPFDISRSALVTDVNSGEVLGMVGELNQSVLRGLKLPAGTAAFEIGLVELAKAAKQDNYRKLSKFPNVQQDISLRVPESTPYQALYDLLCLELFKDLNIVATLTPLDIFQRSEDTTHKHISFRLVIAHHIKTLKSEEVNAMLDSAAKVAYDKLGAERL